MNFEWIESVAFIALVLAAIPFGLFLVNLSVYRPIRREEATRVVRRGDFRSDQVRAIAPAISVLIPARNEEGNIRRTLEAVLENRGADFEVIVLDDHSTDATGSIVREFAARDSRVRLALAPRLPSGWCGKQHACHCLAKLARHPLLVFIDADVRLSPDALAAMSGFMTARPGVALASGVPHQELGTFSEKLLLPLIHFVLLGYLPMPLMRATRKAGFSAGCGQLFVAWAEAYQATGGHARIRTTLHDGVMLPRLFRRAGYRTDLFDATDLATCRMYHTNRETWSGLGKNATEGLGAPGTIVPMTALLLGGQVLPFLLMPMASALAASGQAAIAAAIMTAWLPRLIAVTRFRQPLGSALLHPVGVLALVVIQWLALVRRFAGKASVWKGRSYAPVMSRRPAKAT